MCRNSSRVVTCREFHRSRRQSVKQSSTTNVRTHRAGSSLRSEEASTLLGFHDESILFSKYSPNFCSRECVFFPLNPIYNPPYTRPRRKTESKSFFLRIWKILRKLVLAAFNYEKVIANDRIECTYGNLEDNMEKGKSPLSGCLRQGFLLQLNRRFKYNSQLVVLW